MPYRVLINDDSPALRSFGRRIIELSGFAPSHYLEAGDGEEALSLLRRDWADAVLTDINVPGVDGEELLRRVAADEMPRSVPAIVNSTNATENRTSRSRSLRARLCYQAVPQTLVTGEIARAALWREPSAPSSPAEGF